MITGLPSIHSRRCRGLQRTRALRLAAGVLCACALLLAAEARADRVAQPVIERAAVLLDEGRYMEARAAFRDALAKDPTDVAALVGMARAEERLGHLLVSQALLDEARALAPGEADVVALDAELRDRRFAATDAFYQFAWGNGTTWHQGGIEPVWHATPTARYGVFAERYVLADRTGFAMANRVGVSGVFGDVDALQVRARLLNSSFSGYPDRLDGALDVSGSVKHMRYQADYAITGIDGAPSAQDDLIRVAGADLRVENLNGEIGWASRFTSAYVKGRLTTFSDGNNYHFAEVGALQDLGFVPVDVELGGFANDSGYEFVYPLALTGYYSYNYQNQIAFKAVIRYTLSRHFDASAVGDVGTVETKIPFWAYNPQSYQQFAPELRYTNRSLELSASGSFAQVLGGVNVLNYESNQVSLSARLRL
jgi:tetratricopeptide (TPR) repeat protein